MNDDSGITSSRPGAGLLDETRFRTLAARALDPLPGSAARGSGGERAVRRGGRGDWDLNPRSLEDWPMPQAPRAAAVLVPVLVPPGPRGELSVLLTQRADDMQVHAGQISFPGGKMEKCDAGPLDAALREAHEEIGLARKFIEPLGLSDVYRTATGFEITPVVALVRPGFTLTLDAREVACSFEVPLRFLMDEANHQLHSRQWRGAERFFYAIPYQDRYIWGATAGIIKNLHERLAQA